MALLLVISLVLSCHIAVSVKLPEENMKPVEMINHNGFPAEQHDVKTDDGYILTMHRIPYGRNDIRSAGTRKRPVFFLQHGLLCSSTNWISNLPHQSLGFILADAGFDVWLGNFRGNTYSRSHVYLTPDDHQFWEFSWDEMAEYDLPAMINYALNRSGSDQLYYVGHSEGTMTAFAKFSSDLDFGKKIKHYFALAPAAKIKHVKGLFGVMGKSARFFEWLFETIDDNEFLPNNWVIDVLAKTVCGFTWTDPLCSNVLFMIAGPNSNQLNDTRMPVYLTHTPAGTSTQNMVHFAQGVEYGTYGKYDHGSAQANQAAYGQPTPPAYHPELMETPVTLYSSLIDWLADPEDVKYLNDTLTSVTKHVVLDDFNHLDFIWGLRAAPEIYADIVTTALNMERKLEI